MNRRGFLMVEVLIASLIISSGIIAGFFLIRSGILNVSKHSDSTYIVSNMPQIINYIDTHNNLPQQTEIAGMTVKFRQHNLRTYTPTMMAEDGGYIKLPFEVSLIKVDIEVYHKNAIKSYVYYKLSKKRTDTLNEE